MPKKPTPLTDLQRQKGFNIRKEGGAPADKSTRKIMDSKVWPERNTRGNPKPKR